jgi:3-oxoadipate enol-lactonase
MNNDTVPLYFEEFGSGTPIILVHGFPLDHTIWEPVIAPLTKHSRIILPDLRGFGHSPVPPGKPSIRMMADDLVALLDLLKIDKAIMVGHSMGGYVCLVFARAYPHRLAGLGLVTTQAAADTPEKRQSRLNTADDVEKHGVKVIADNMVPKLTANADLQATLRNLIMKTDPVGVIYALKAMADRPDSTEFLSSISVPSVVLAGSADSLIPVERSRTMAQLLARAWLAELPGVGHMPMMEAPQQAAETLRQLIHAVEGFAPG